MAKNASESTTSFMIPLVFFVERLIIEMTKKVFLLLYTFVFIMICACRNESQQFYPPKINTNENQIFLFDPFNNMLGIYDVDTQQWHPVDAQGAFFQSFDWGNKSPYYVVGQQHIFPFYVGKISNSSLQFHYVLENKNQSLCPFATDGKLFLFLIEEVTEDDYIKRVVTITDNGLVHLIANLDGMPVMEGRIVGDYLYFTCPIDNSDFYNVWKININEHNSDIKPILVRSDYQSFHLYQYQDQLLYLDIENQHLYNDEITINLTKKPDLLMIDDQADIMVEAYVTAENHFVITFIDILTGSILGTYADAINFFRSDSEITIYGNGFIDYLYLQ